MDREDLTLDQHFYSTVFLNLSSLAPPAVGLMSDSHYSNDLNRYWL